MYSRYRKRDKDWFDLMDAQEEQEARRIPLAGGLWRIFHQPESQTRPQKYISHQAEHHRKESFQEEYRRVLKKYEIEFDERYVWD
jgi:hypothetical protein